MNESFETLYHDCDVKKKKSGILNDMKDKKFL